MRRPKTLTAAFCRSVSKPGAYGDGRGGNGLILRVTRSRSGRTAKHWVQRVRIDGRPTHVGLGSFPVVGLAEARKRALANSKAISEGKDPRGGGIPTFEQATDRTIRLHAKGWKPGSRTESAWRSGFARHVYPKIGSTPIDQITTGDLLAVVGPIWHTTPRQAELLRRRISQVMRWAIAQGYRADDPAGPPLTAALPKNGKAATHHRALDHGEVAGMLRKVDASNAAAATKLAIRFIAATACRTGEARGATWSEIDVDTATWTVGGERTKTGRPFRVALSAAALGVLDEAAELSKLEGGLVFPGRGGKQVGHGSLAAAFRRLNAGTVHGLRSSFRDWCGETGVRRELAEAALSHTVKGVEGAYARSDLLELRRPIMEQWGEYITH